MNVTLAPSASADPVGVEGIYRIGKTFTGVEAAHQLGGLPEDHKCGRLHGHSYTVTVTIAATGLTGPGFVVDFAGLDPLKVHLATDFDHRFLNDVVDVEPTSENFAKAIFDWCAAKLDLPCGAYVEAVKVSETDNTWAEYRLRPVTERA